MTDRDRALLEALEQCKANQASYRWCLAVDALEAAVWGNPREYSRIAAQAVQAIERARR